MNIGKYNATNKREWAVQLNHPKTGISIGFTDLGNTEKLGKAYTFMPFIEFPLFPNKTKKWNLQTGFGGAYLDTKYHIENNPTNQGITTRYNWAYRSFLYYDVLKKRRQNWRLGMGFIHYSNGHTQLPNQGLNSLLISISSTINSSTDEEEQKTLLKKTRTSTFYYSIRGGIGQNALTKNINNRKEVFSYTVSAGKIINNTFKLGGGFHYRFYEHYYDHIKNNGVLIDDEAPSFRNNPYKNATNFGFFVTSELLLNHIGFEFDLGFNIYKPFYRIDWHLNRGYPSSTVIDGKSTPIYVLGELNWYYKVKRIISSRLGLKYYLFAAHKEPKHNLFIAAHINANLGQADFSELSFGYVHRFK